MRARVLWPHIQDHRLASDGAIRDQVAEFVDRDVQFLFQHKTRYLKNPLLYGVRFTFIDLIKIEGKLNFFVSKGIVLPERMALPVMRHDYAAGI